MCSQAAAALPDAPRARTGQTAATGRDGATAADDLTRVSSLRDALPRLCMQRGREEGGQPLPRGSQPGTGKPQIQSR